METTEHFDPLFNEQNEHYHKRYLTFYGGRGGMKTWQIARGLLLRGVKKPETVLCTREFLNSMADSVMAVLEGQAELIGLDTFYDFQKTTILGGYAGKTNFLFKGLRRNINSIKSTEGITLVWNEEAQETSQESIDKLYPTVIRNEGAQIINSFNPLDEKDPIYVRHVLKHNDKTSYLCKVNYIDNPWITEAFVEEALEMRASDYDAYMHIYGGECWSRSEAQVLSGKWVVEHFEAEEDFGNPYFGADWGFSQDPTALIKCWIAPHPYWGDNCLYIEQEAVGRRIDNDDLPEHFMKVTGAKKYRIRADSARPETISHMQRRGFDVVGAEKWSGSVEDGIATLRGFDKIIIHPDCVHTKDEARLYCHKQDKLTDDILRDIIDKHNHCWDAVRYGLEPITKKRIQGMTKKQLQDLKKPVKITTTAPSDKETNLW